MKRLGLAVLPLLLAACGGTGLPTGTRFEAEAGISGARIDAQIVRVIDKASGMPKRTETRFVLTQPQVRFVTRAGSIGGTVQRAEVEITDGSGNRFADVGGLYIQSFSAQLLPGWACTNAAGTAQPDVNPYTCPATSRVGYPRPQVFAEAGNNGSVQLVSPNAAEVALDDCVVGPCPANLTMSVQFTVLDDNRGTSVIKVEKSPIPVYRVSDTTVEE
jgi:hypothetical protein